jgi:threonine dehydrogenase-like Zn-dependent dehydrogenase
MKTEAAMLSDVGRIRMVSLQLPPLRPKDILVEVEMTGLCGSDMAVYLGKHAFKKPPIVLGHEFSGIVRQVGEAVTAVRTGERVCAASFTHCGNCDGCRRGNTHLCRSKRVICTGDWHGSFASHVNVTENMVTALPRGVDPERGVLVEPLSIGLHAMRLPAAITGKSVAIIGAGSIGLACLLAAKKLGAGRVVCVDKGDFKRGIAARLGADGYVDARSEDVVGGTRGALGEEADVAVLACSYDDIFAHAKMLTKPGGDVVAVSYFDSNVRLNLNDFLRSEITVRFSYCSTPGDFLEVIDWLSLEGFDPTPIVTHRVSLSQADRALRLKKENPEQVGKMIFDLSDNDRANPRPEFFGWGSS